MLFTQLEFFLFFPCVTAVFYLLRSQGLRLGFLTAASYFFYGFADPWFCTLILISTLVDYNAALFIERRPEKKKVALWFSLLCNLGILGTFKYFNFFIEQFASLGLGLEDYHLALILPAGISFYTFQTLSYTVDVYRGEIKAEPSFIKFAAFVSFFPQLVAGPIERAGRLLPQLSEKPRPKFSNFTEGAKLVNWGLFKKLVIADNLSGHVSRVYLLENPSIFLLTAGTIAFAAQIYCDFSGYTDIARGAAKMMGIDLVRNFKAPYLAISPSDFWRRWHISLSEWFRDYVYIPLGGNKRVVFAAFASMLLSGLWHGAAWNFVLWGFYHALWLLIFHLIGIGGKWKPRFRFPAWLFMSCITIFGWGIFRTHSIAWYFNVWTSGALLGNGDEITAAVTILALTFILSIPTILRGLVPEKFQTGIAGHIILAYLSFLLAPEDPQDFIYFRF